METPLRAESIFPTSRDLKLPLRYGNMLTCSVSSSGSPDLKLPLRYGNKAEAIAAWNRRVDLKLPLRYGNEFAIENLTDLNPDLKLPLRYGNSCVFPSRFLEFFRFKTSFEVWKLSYLQNSDNAPV